MYLSASRIKTYLTCSFIYYCKYVLGFSHMDESNDGAKRGTISHLILEVLQNKRRRNRLEKFINNGYSGDPAIYKLVKKHAIKLGVDDPENMSLIESFIQVGLKTDFLCDGWDLQEPEKKFQIESEYPRYKILGFIDKHAFAFDGSIARIDDYKTSKQKFTGKDKAFNIQALLYALALKKESQATKFDVNFIFLKFPKSPLQTFSFDTSILNGFEVYLADVYAYLEKFNTIKAIRNLARYNENYFLCGKEPGDLKKDGSPAWVCPWKRPFLYYEVKNSDGKIIFTSKDRDKALDKMKDGDTLSSKAHLGCPAFCKI